MMVLRKILETTFEEERWTSCEQQHVNTMHVQAKLTPIAETGSQQQSVKLVVEHQVDEHGALAISVEDILG
jgi:hypothetical protein